MQREYCCTECGLIWFGKYEITSDRICPGCNNHMGNLNYPIFACDSTGWLYASENAVVNLKQRGKRIHYAKDHPWFYKNT